MAIENGCLLLADISGYTKYLTGVELEHSHDILADLLSVVVGQLQARFQLAKLEGDAVFCVAPIPDDLDVPPAPLVAVVEATYFAFVGRLRDIKAATTCRCEACRLIPSLSLKFLVHHGQYAVHEVLGNRELVGPEVIVAHRLLKNSITETTGLRGYALFTQPCVDRFGLDPEAAGMRAHTEAYEDVGTVEGWLLDLERRWREEQERISVRLEAGSLIDERIVVPAPAAVVWEWATDPARRLRWQPGVTGVRQDAAGGLPGVGTVNHCMHGPDAIVETILDWKPFRYFTDRSVLPDGTTTVLNTIELLPADDGGTEVAFLMDPPSPDLREAFAPLGEMFRPVIQQALVLLRDAIAAEAATGPVPSDEPVAAAEP